MNSIAIALIHNNNIDRLPTAKKVYESLRAKLLALGFEVKIFEIHKQPEIQTISRNQCVRRKSRSGIIQFKYFAFYLNSSPRFWIPYLIQFFTAFRHFFMKSKHRKLLHVEEIITFKHYQAWKIGIGFDFLIVLEDDVIQLGNLENFLQRFQYINQLREENAIYIDLAGGYSLNQVAPGAFQFGDCEVDKFYSNTSCAYILNRFLCDHLTTCYRFGQLTSKIGVDFFINYSFTKLKKPSGLCFHLRDSGFMHGSFTNNYESWTQDY